MEEDCGVYSGPSLVAYTVQFDRARQARKEGATVTSSVPKFGASWSGEAAKQDPSHEAARSPKIPTFPTSYTACPSNQAGSARAVT
eukprot:SM000162S02386  [mRNA]  locus=s162:231246:231782:+ [translate_table: standard]